MEDFKEIMAMIVGVLLLVFVVVFSGVIPIVYSINKKSCLSAYNEYTPSYTLWGGCKVEWNGKLTPVDIIREIK